VLLKQLFDSHDISGLQVCRRARLPPVRKKCCCTSAKRAAKQGAKKRRQACSPGPRNENPVKPKRRSTLAA
jgi:hypothetical protein